MTMTMREDPTTINNKHALFGQIEEERKQRLFFERCIQQTNELITGPFDLVTHANFLKGLANSYRRYEKPPGSFINEFLHRIADLYVPSTYVEIPFQTKFIEALIGFGERRKNYNKKDLKIHAKAAFAYLVDEVKKAETKMLEFPKDSLEYQALESVIKVAQLFIHGYYWTKLIAADKAAGFSGTKLGKYLEKEIPDLTILFPVEKVLPNLSHCNGPV